MAEMTIMLRRDPATGKQNIIVKLDPDPDALPVEHEQMHRRLVEKLVGRGLNPDELGPLIIEREGEAQPAAPVPGAAEPEKQKAANKG